MQQPVLQKLTILLTILGSLTACKLTTSHDSTEISHYQQQNPEVQRLGQIRFLADPLGSLSLKGLMAGNIMPIKIYGTALMLAENPTSPILDSEQVPVILEKYGVMRASEIKNWNNDLGPRPEMNGNIGFIHAEIDEKILGQRYKIEVANISCSGCHSSPVFDRFGNATKAVWIGAANTSLHLDGLLGQVYKGLKIGLADRTLFMKQIRQAYPQIDALEVTTIEAQILPKVAEEIEKMTPRGGVLPFKNGGPGLANGLGQFKKNANLLENKYAFYPKEANFVQIPDLSDRQFRSSFTVDGINGSTKYPRFQEITLEKLIDQNRLQDLARIVTFFPYLAMSTIEENLLAAVPRTQEIFNDFMVTYRPQPFPGVVNSQMAARGAIVFENNCSRCHGSYSSGVNGVHMISFPNKLISQKFMKTDPVRWQNVTQQVLDYSSTSQLSQLSKPAPAAGGYVAPILTGIWSTAPYLHNSSVPTLWHLMNPEIRPRKFQYGGHAIDLDWVGTKGQTTPAGDWMYPSDYISWSQSFIYDTTEYGRSNQGHEQPFDSLEQTQKKDLLEYMKLL